MNKEIIIDDIPIKNSNRTLDVYYELDKTQCKYRMFTDALKYGSHLEIVFSNSKQCFAIKDFYRIKENWLKKHGQPERDVDNVIKNFMDVI